MKAVIEQGKGAGSPGLQADKKADIPVLRQPSRQYRGQRANIRYMRLLQGGLLSGLILICR